MAATEKNRSWVMSRVKSRNTTPELTVRRLLSALKYRYRLHAAALPGQPDIVFASRKSVIFVHGCYWHGHNCPRGSRVPKTNRDYWVAKIDRNKARDANQLRELDAKGWRALVVWDCELKSPDRVKTVITRFLEHGAKKQIKNIKRTLDPARKKAPKRHHAAETGKRPPRTLQS